MTIFPYTEHILLGILSQMLPLYNRKMRRVFYFLDSVIKHLPHIKERFDCFKITLTGKIRGGTKRTSQLIIGYGRVAVNSLKHEIFNNFMAFTHVYGEFGVKLLMARALPKYFLHSAK